MANVRGKGKLKDRELIVSYYDNQTHNGLYFLDVELNAMDLDENKDPQGNLHLNTKKIEKDGNVYYNHGVAYTEDQLNTIREAAGDNCHKTEAGQNIYGVKGDLLINKQGQLIVNTKTVEASNYELSDDYFDNQRYFENASREITAKNREADKEVEKEQEAQKQSEGEMEY